MSSDAEGREPRRRAAHVHISDPGVLDDARFRAAAVPFRAAYDPQALTAIAALEQTA